MSPEGQTIGDVRGPTPPSRQPALTDYPDATDVPLLPPSAGEAGGGYRKVVRSW